MDKTSFTEKLCLVQHRLKAPKKQFNKFGKYYYRSCEDILEALKPLLSEIGMSLTISDDIVLIGDRFYVKSTAVLTDGSESISNTAFARESESKSGMDGSQITGTASSYARKYCLNGLFLIDDNKDPDTNDYKETQINAEKSQEKEDEILKEALEEISKCPSGPSTTNIQLRNVYLKYRDRLGSNETFLNAVQARSKDE